LPWPETAAAATAARPDGADPEGGSKNPEPKGPPAQALAQATSAAGASLGASPAGALKSRAGNGSLGPEENSASPAAAPRSRLLREAVPAEPSGAETQDPPQRDDAAKIANANGPREEIRGAERQESGALDSAPPLPSPQESQATGLDGASGPGGLKAGLDGGTENASEDTPQARPAAAERSGASSRSTLLDRLRGVAEETVDK
jgi:hypothetical protein